MKKVGPISEPRSISARGFLQCAAVVGTLTIFAVLSAANASTIALSLYSTGVDNTGAALAGGSVDPHYLVIENGNANAVVINTPAVTYFPNNATSTWVWQSADAQPRNVTRTFTTTFDLTGYDPSTVVISGAWGTDNQGLEIDLNGNNTGIPGLLGVIVANFDHLTTFSISTGFVSGINTLAFVIEDNGGSNAAFRAELSATASLATPLPAALPLFASGLGALGLLGWRRRRKAIAAAA